jgi:hypothetical protein
MKKIALICMLLVAGSINARATQITISSFQIANSKYTGTVKLRLYSSNNWTDSDGVAHVAGVAGSATGFYQEVSCTVSSGTITCPSFTTPSTVDSIDRPQTRITGILAPTTGSPTTLFTSWVIPNSATTLTWKQLVAYNSAQPRPLGDSYMTAAQVLSLVAEAATASAVPPITGFIPSNAQLYATSAPPQVDTTSTTSSANTSFSWQHVNTGNLLVVFVESLGSGPSAVTFQGTGLTKLDSQVVGGAGGRVLEVWYLLAPAVTTGTVAITTTATQTLAAALSVKNALTAPTSAKFNGTSAQPVSAIPASVQDLVIDGVALVPTPIASHGQTQKVNFGNGSFRLGVSTKPGANNINGVSNAMTWAATSSDWAAISIVVRPNATIPITPSNCSIIAPHTVQLFGPVQAEGALIQTPTSLWEFPGSALTASTKTYWFSDPFPGILSVVWRLIWKPESTANVARLVYFDDGPANIVPIAYIYGTAAGGPVNVTAIVSPEFQALAANKQYKNIGWQVIGNGSAPITVYESRLEFRICTNLIP